MSDQPKRLPPRTRKKRSSKCNRCIGERTSAKQRLGSVLRTGTRTRRRKSLNRARTFVSSKIVRRKARSKSQALYTVADADVIGARGESGICERYNRKSRSQCFDMSYTKPTAIGKAADAILGCFSVFSPTEFIDHLVRYLGTWSGSDKLFAIIEYTLKLLVPLLHKRAQIQKNAGLREIGASSTAARFSKFAGSISSSRTLWRFWGLLTIIRWMISLEHTAQPTRKLLNIERLQGWSMFGYYPLEQLSYLVSNEILPSRSTIDLSPFVTKKTKLELNAGKMGLWSVRCWAVYVALQFAHLHEDRKLLQARYHTLRKAGLKPAEKQELQKRWHAYWSDLVVNMANFPLALHWSMGSRLIKQDYVVALLNLIVAIVSFRSGWKATALPSTPPAESIDDSPEPVFENATAYDV